MNKITCDEFIKLVKSDPDRWMHYCEVLMTPTGSIILLNGSHQITAIEYMIEETGKTKEEISKMIPPEFSPFHLILDKYRLVGIWYNFYYHSSSGMNRFQKRSIDKLIANGVLSENCYPVPVNEYKVYKNRVKLGITKEVEGL